MEAPNQIICQIRQQHALGDSLYAGYGLNRGEGFPEELQNSLADAGLNAFVFNAGVSGDTSAAGRGRLDYALEGLPRKPDLVILGLGGNDMLRAIEPSETRNNMEAMVKSLSDKDIPVMLTGMLAPPNMGPDFAAQFNLIFPSRRALSIFHAGSGRQSGAVS